MNKHIFNYEMKLVLTNYSCLFFGLVFPLLMGALVVMMLNVQVPEPFREPAKQSVLFTMNIISPLSIFLIGHATITAKDMEEGVYDRLELFSIKQFTLARYKFLAYFLFFLVCNLIYFTVMVWVFDIPASVIEILRHLGYVTLLNIGCFFIAYAICLFTKKYSISFAITMAIYFAIMIFSGMMGIRVEDMPEGLQKIVSILPTSHFSSYDYLKEIQTGTINASFLIGLLVLVGLSMALMALAIFKQRRKNA
ncbi:ABC transporter permease [Facklamia languida]